MEKNFSDNTLLLKAENLSIGYKSRKKTKTLIKNIDLKVFKGDFISLIGKNGTGKSSLLRTLVALEKALSGEIFYRNQNIQKINPSQRAKQISLVLSPRSLPINFTVYETVLLGRYPHTNWQGIVKKEDKEKVLESIHLVGMNDFLENRWQTLSDGERQKVMIARALAQDTPLLLLDEPTAHLDWAARRMIFQLLKHISKTQQKGILVATHELDLALQFSEKICLIDNAQHLHQSSPKEIANSDFLEKTFQIEGITFKFA